MRKKKKNIVIEIIGIVSTVRGGGCIDDGFLIIIGCCALKSDEG